MDARHIAPAGDHDWADLVGRVLGALGTARAAVEAAVEAAVGAPGAHQECPPGSGSALPGEAASQSRSRPGEQYPEPRPLIRTKVLGETCLLLRAVAPVTALDSQLEAAATALAAQVAPHIRDDELLTAIATEPGRALDRAFGHLHLRDLGNHDHVVDSLLSQSVALGPAGSAERMPTRALEQLWLHRLWSGDPTGDNREPALLQQSVIGRPLDVLGCSTLDLYSLTHIVLYTSDSGRRPAVLPRPVDEVMADIEAALAVALDVDNFDLAAELLWAWPMLGQRWSPIARFTMVVLAGVQDQHGFLPGPGYSRAHHHGRPAQNRDRYLLETSYHADLVMGILCASTLHRGGIHPAPEVATAPDGAVDALLEHLELREQLRQRGPATGPRWLQDVRSRQAVDRAALSPLLLTAALRRAAADHDLSRSQAILRTARSHGLLDLPAAAQALVLLRRSASLMKVLGTRQSDLPSAPVAAAAALASHAGARP